MGLELGKQRAPGWIGQGLEGAVERRRLIVNHSVN
jgi:hypothetical protein